MTAFFLWNTSAPTEEGVSFRLCSTICESTFRASVWHPKFGSLDGYGDTMEKALNDLSRVILANESTCASEYFDRWKDLLSKLSY